MPFPSYMQGTPDELLQRSQETRGLQQKRRLDESQAFDARWPMREVGKYPSAEGINPNLPPANAEWAAKSYKWNPAVDALEAFSYQDPASQNQGFADMAQADAPGPVTPWQKYGAVLQARGAASPIGLTAPSSIENDTRYAGSVRQQDLNKLLRLSQSGAPASALRGLQKGY